MALAYCDIEYQFQGGPKKHAIHGLQCDQFEAGSLTFTEQDAAFWGALLPVDEDYANATDPLITDLPNIPATLIPAIIRYHRAVHAVGTLVNAFRIYNGPTLIETPPLNHRVELNLACRGTEVYGLAPNGQSLDSLAPGNVALLIDKSAATFGNEGGQIWLRYALAKDSIQIGDNDGVMLKPSIRSALVQQHHEAFDDPLGLRISDWTTFRGFGGGPGADSDGVAIAAAGASYVVINTTKVEGAGLPHLAAGSRYVSGFTFVGTLTVDDAQSRQYNRKGKKKVVAP